MNDNVVLAAPRFVTFMRADEYDRVVVTGGLAVNQALSAPCFLAADNTDGMEFRNFLSDTEKLWHGAKRLATEVCIETSNNDTYVVIGKLLDKTDDGHVEELNLIYGYNCGVGGKQRKYLGSGADMLCLDILAVVTG